MAEVTAARIPRSSIAGSGWTTRWPGWTCCCTGPAGACRSPPARPPSAMRRRSPPGGRRPGPWENDSAATWRGRGVVSLGPGPDGKRIRRKVSGKTRAVVQERLRTLHGDLDAGVRARPNYTLRRAAEDWLREGLDGRSAKTIKKNENVLEPMLTAIGARRLRELTAADVHQALNTIAARYSTAAVAMGHNALTRVIRHAQARDLASRNVAPLVHTPNGQTGRPSN